MKHTVYVINNFNDILNMQLLFVSDRSILMMNEKICTPV